MTARRIRVVTPCLWAYMGNLGLEVRLKGRAFFRLVTAADVEPRGGFALVAEPILELAKVRAVRMGWGIGQSNLTHPSVATEVRRQYL